MIHNHHQADSAKAETTSAGSAARSESRGRGRRSRVRLRARLVLRVALVGAIVVGTAGVCLTTTVMSPTTTGEPQALWTTAAAARLIEDTSRAQLVPFGSSRAGGFARADQASDQAPVAASGTLGSEVTIVADGETLVVTTSAGRVAEVLGEAGVLLGPDDSVAPILSATVSDGQTITVSRTSYGQVQEEVVLPFESVRQDDGGIFKGEERVAQEGRDGRRVVTYQTKLVDGVEAERSVLVEIVLAEPVTEVVNVGTKERPTVPNVNINVDPGSAQGIARGMVSDDSQFACLVELWNRESGWNATLANPYSGAYGIPQALPGHKMASAGADWQTNPETQIRWGLGYIAGRYGDPCGAWAAFQVQNWY